MYVYIQSEPGLWTVGYYYRDGKWQAESDHESSEAAAARVHYLNGEKGRCVMTQDQIDSYVTNPPAFPRPLSKLTSEEVSSDQEGMTLRDYFAAQSLPLVGYRMDAMDANWTYDHLASAAYEIADAMLTERQKGGAS